MLYLKQSTASQAVLIGPFIDDTDGKTAETGLTIANTDIRLSKNGGNMAAKNSGGGTHDEAGWYAITLDATDSDTVGRLQISSDVAGALPVWAEFQVVEEDTYTWFFASGAAPDTQVAAIKTVVDAIPTTAMRGTDSAALASVCTETRLSELDAGTAGKAANQIDEIRTDTENIQSRLPTALVSSRMDATIDATGMESGAVDSIWAKTMTELAAVPGVTGTVLAALEWLFQLARNKGTQTSTAKTLRNDADDGDIATSVISSDGATFTREKWS